MKTNHFDMSVCRYIGISVLLLANGAVWAQQDTALNRSVTVERDFQPVIQSAGKVATKPVVVETEMTSYQSLPASGRETDKQTHV